MAASVNFEIKFLNNWSTNILNGGAPSLINVTTPVSASNFKNDTAEIKECWV